MFRLILADTYDIEEDLQSDALKNSINMVTATQREERYTKLTGINDELDLLPHDKKLELKQP